MSAYVVPFEALGKDDIHRVGGKNASLGEMIQHLGAANVRVPGGFATTTDAYRAFLTDSGLDRLIHDTLDGLDVNDTRRLGEAASLLRRSIMAATLPTRLTAEIEASLSDMSHADGRLPALAVRSSATAEDLPQASFAGQQETYLNVRGRDAVMTAVHQVFASLFTDRAIAYRVHHGFPHHKVLLSAGIQRMVRSDLGASGVLFTLDTESGFDQVVFITAAYGLGETVVQGAVNPDEFYVHKPRLADGFPAILRRHLGDKAIAMVYGQGDETTDTVAIPVERQQQFCISDEQVLELARLGVTIEQHYGRAMDVEWGLDGEDGRLYILQARPETVASQAPVRQIERYRMLESGEMLVSGRSIGHRIGAGSARVIMSVTEMEKVDRGDVLVTDMTDPDWEPIMQRASAIVTNRGGRTCHAAIIARELGIPAVVGCGDATRRIQDGQEVTVSCAEGDTGQVYRGRLGFDCQVTALDRLPELPLKLMMNVANPERAFDFAAIPNAGIGLARLEFIITRTIGIHPRALLEPQATSEAVRAQIQSRTVGYADGVSFYIDRLSQGIATLAASVWPKPVIVRLSDFKSNEYRNLLGGEFFEPVEENPMIGLRGAARYVDDSFRACFELECRALKRVREELGLSNVEAMIPFVRTVDEGRAVVDLMATNGLARGQNGLRIIMMCEIPSNALLADEFLEHFDGYSIGSNDLTQLTLGLDRDSGLVAGSFDERNPAVKALISMAIERCNARGKYVGICGQGPSDHPDLAVWLMEQGIQSMSLNPDTVVDTWLQLAESADKKRF